MKEKDLKGIDPIELVKEIRIGNLFMDYSGKVFSSTLNDFALLHNENLCISEIIKEVLPLNEKWLEDFGFEQKDNNYSFLDWRFHIHKPSNYDGFLLCEGYSVITDRIEYVNQLQNIYFALCGEELTIKQPIKK